jgi:hypothetical protein
LTLAQVLNHTREIRHLRSKCRTALLRVRDQAHRFSKVDITEEALLHLPTQAEARRLKSHHIQDTSRIKHRIRRVERRKLYCLVEEEERGNRRTGIQFSGNTRLMIDDALIPKFVCSLGRKALQGRFVCS